MIVSWLVVGALALAGVTVQLPSSAQEVEFDDSASAAVEAGMAALAERRFEDASRIFQDLADAGGNVPAKPSGGRQGSGGKGARPVAGGKSASPGSGGKTASTGSGAVKSGSPTSGGKTAPTATTRKCQYCAYPGIYSNDGKYYYCASHVAYMPPKKTSAPQPAAVATAKPAAAPGGWQCVACGSRDTVYLGRCTLNEDEPNSAKKYRCNDCNNTIRYEGPGNYAY